MSELCPEPMYKSMEMYIRNMRFMISSNAAYISWVTRHNDTQNLIMYYENRLTYIDKLRAKNQSIATQFYNMYLS